MMIMETSSLGEIVKRAAQIIEMCGQIRAARDGERLGGYACILKEATGIVNSCADVLRHLAQLRAASLTQEGATDGKP
jgi:hypothetical protein